MDLTFTQNQEEFRNKARTWLEAHVPSQPLASFDTKEGFEQHRKWEATMAKDQWSVVNWPKQFGGKGLGVIEWLIFEEEYHRKSAPLRVSQNGIFLLGPTLLEFGTTSQKDRFLKKMACAEEIWCQGWSEPDAGSDLASIRSKATQNKDGSFVLSGQKTWSSRGAFADWCFGLFRTGEDRHRGLTYFLIPMDAPGVTVRPIEQLDGKCGFAEIFFDDVLVPPDSVLGQVGSGWQVAMSTAGSERGLTLRSPARYSEAARRLAALFFERGAPPYLSDDVARCVIDAEAYQLHTYWSASHGKVGPEASCNKIFWSENDLAIHSAALSLLGDEAFESPWWDSFLFSLGGPIYAGTNEVQRNVIAERLLGLPR